MKEENEYFFNLYQDLLKICPIEIRWKPSLCYLFCYLFTCILSQANAQEAIPVFRHLNIDNGLLNYYVAGIAQDDKGFLWFATDHGLNRYDGREIVQFLYDPSDSTGISGNNLRAVEIAEDGQMWVAQSNKGIDRFNPITEAFTHFDLNGRISSVTNDQDEGTWVGTNTGLYFLKKEAKKFVKLKFSPHPWQRAIAEIEVKKVHIDKDQNLLVATNLGLYQIGINKVLGQWILPCSQKPGSSDPEFIVYDIAISKENKRLWLTSEHGLFELDAEANCLIPFTINGETPFSNQAIRVVTLGKKGKLWLGNSDADGIYSLDIVNGQITHLSPIIDENIAGSTISEIFIDESGIVWISTTGNGLHIYDPKTSHFKWFGQSNNNKDIPSGFIRANSVFEDSKGVRWICTDRGVEWGDALGAKTYPLLKSKLAQIKTGIYKVHETANGIFWMGTVTGGIIRLNAANGILRFYFKTPALLGGKEANNIVTAFCQDRKGNIWLGFWGGGLVFIDKNKPDQPKIIPCDSKDTAGLNECYIKKIFESEDGMIWIGGANGGGFIKHNPKTGSFKRYLPDPNNPTSISHDYVRNILEDDKHHLWLGTSGGGLNYFDPTSETFLHYTKKDGLPNDFINALAKDDNGYLWISTATALSKFDPTTSVFQNFDSDNGLPKTQLHGFTDPHPITGQMILGTDKGFIVFHPDSISIDTLAPKTHIVKMERYRRNVNNGEPILEKGIAYKKEINLTYDDYIVTFELAAITYRKADKVQMAYKLEGFQDDWIQLGSKRQISFTSLPANDYTLLIKSANADGIWNENPTRLKIRVSPPWWRTWWAYGLYALTLSFIFWFFSRRELRRIRLQNELEKESLERERLEELDEVKTQFLTNVSHEFRTPLTVILGMTEEIEEPKSAKKLIRKSSENLLRLVNQLLDFGKLEAGKLTLQLQSGDLIAYLKYLLESFHSLATHKNVQLFFESSQEQLIMDYDEEKIQHIISNLLSNAIKFTPRDGQVILSVGRVASTINIQVKDTGIGIAAHHLPRIFERFYQVGDPMSKGEPGTGIGLAFTKELVLLMNGKIEAESEEEEGTTFKLSLPFPNSAAIPPVIKKSSIHLTNPETAIAELSEVKHEKPQLLLIEDTPEVVAYIRTLLHATYNIMVAENGAIGIEKAIESIPDIIISDVMMPIKDGFAVTQFLKNDERSSHIPIVLLTAKADVASRLSGLERGADAYLAKPFDKKELLVRLERLVELRKKLQSRYAQFAPPDQSDDIGIQMEDAFLEKLNGIIEANLTEAEFNVSELCSEMLMSRSQLFRKLKALTGKSIVAYLRSARLHKAKEFLQIGELNITEIAFAVGFNDPKYFSRVFSQEFGQAPKDFN